MTIRLYQINGREVSASVYAEYASRLLGDALDFRQRVQAWHESVGKAGERTLDPFVMWVQMGDLLNGHAVTYDRTEPAHIGGCNDQCREGNHWLREDEDAR